MFLHVLNTWFIANLLQPLFVILFSFLFLLYPDPYTMPGFTWNSTLLVCLFLVSIIGSLPLLLVTAILFQLIARMEYTQTARFVCWLFTVVGGIFIIFLILAFLFNTVNFQTLAFGFPAMSAACVAILLRYRQFIKIISPEKIVYETDC